MARDSALACARVRGRSGASCLIICVLRTCAYTPSSHARGERELRSKRGGERGNKRKERARAYWLAFVYGASGYNTGRRCCAVTMRFIGSLSSVALRMFIPAIRTLISGIFRARGQFCSAYCLVRWLQFCSFRSLIRGFWHDYRFNTISQFKYYGMMRFCSKGGWDSHSCFITCGIELPRMCDVFDYKWIRFLWNSIVI